MSETIKYSPSVNALTAPLVKHLIDNADALRIAVSKLDNGVVVIDAGINVPGGLEAGRIVSEICLGGLGKVSLRAGKTFANWPWHLDVYSSHPVIACLASQYAGWSLSHGDGKNAFMALGSGPARALGSREELYEELKYRDKGAHACMVIEVDKFPPVELAGQIAERCGVTPESLTLVLTPTSSLAGSIQVVARSLEVALHKVHSLHFPLEQVIDGASTAPICPPSPDFITAMGRTNDAILFGAHTHLFVNCGNEEAEDLAQKLPSSTSKDYGKPFGQVFKDYNYDFYKIDPMLFSPARVTVTSMKTGKSFQAGALNEELLELSFS
jgi:methenyltetrahydromethanopterin cyclohydrolase